MFLASQTHFECVILSPLKAKPQTLCPSFFTPARANTKSHCFFLCFFFPLSLSLSLVSVANASTIISTDINTGGTLTVTGTSNLKDKLYNSSTALTLDQVGQAVTNILLNPTTGNVGIGTANPLFKFDVAGITQIQDYLKTSFVVSTSTATSTFAGGLYASLISSPYFHATSTTATSTFAGGVSITGGGLNVGTIKSCSGSSALTTDSSGVVNCSAIAASGTGTVNTGVANSIAFYKMADTNVYGTSTITILSSGNIGIGTASPLARLQVGNGTVNNSADSQILISRNVDDTISGNGHAFSDSSYITRSGVIGYNSYDARVVIGGTAEFDHYVAFQAAPIYQSSSVIRSLGMYTGTLTNNGGKATQTYNYYANDLVGTGGSAAHYGLWVASLTHGDQNWAVYTEGATPSYFGGDMTLGGNLIVSGKIGLGTSTPGGLVHVKTATYTDTPLFERTFSTDTIGTAFRLLGTDTNNMGNGAGVGLTFSIKDDTAVNNIIADFEAYRNGADNSGNVVISTRNAGTKAAVATFTNTSNVGIGTTSPWGKLSVTQTGTDGAPAFIVEDSASPDTSPFVIDQTGNVGIGTSSPASLLHVSAGTNATTTVEFGAQAITSKTCFNVRDALGAATSFYFVGTAMVIEPNRCR